MTETDAILEIIADAQMRRQPSNSSAKRVLAALKALNVNPAGVIRVLHRLEYTDDAGTPYGNEPFPALVDLSRVRA